MTTITISGPPGSGTTTISKLLSKRLKLPHVYAGEIFRKEAEKKGMTLSDFSKYCKSIQRLIKNWMITKLEYSKKVT